MKSLAFKYNLSISFDAPVEKHSFTLRTVPVTDERQSILTAALSVTPDVRLSHSTDGFGNLLHYGRIDSAHSAFSAELTGTAETGLNSFCLGGDEYREHVFRYNTPLTTPDEALRAFAHDIAGSADVPDTAYSVMQSVHDYMHYLPGKTNVATKAAEAFALRTGVCQDYSHIMLSILREKGIAARYVAGLLIGEGESHAWVEVKDKDRWFGFDPVNMLCVNEDHIKISHGRDSSDCVINRGTFFGFACQTQSVSVSVSER